MIPRLPPVILLAIGGASIYGIKYWMDKMETKSLTGSPEQAEAAKRHLRNVKIATRLGIGSVAMGAAYYVYDSWKERPTPSVVKVKDSEFYDNQYSSRDHSYEKTSQSIEQEQRIRAESNLKRLKEEFVNKK
ncbi:uncharacterized protein BX664DRAFT_389653 [Halteromyces radiatus]|uniref:uncharacterized protein n=1 Tax=Halteromyces radiatus TaxID=101107 RepID=UPI00221FC963|nr:uncharacterized protein BX664DRAFT_389653 [Halteromyces radiatus]KAI8076323.1 hypothetical protein BX664DRAFT_389653 [Halteromyces radiatus]